MARARYIILLAVLLVPAPMGLAQSTEADPRISETRDQIDTLGRLRDEYRELSARTNDLEGEERDVVGLQMRQRYLEFMGELDELVANITALAEEEIEAPELRGRVREILSELSETFPLFIDGIDHRAVELRSLLAEAAAEEAPGLQDRISDHERITDQVYKHFADHLRHLRSLGLPSETGRIQLEKRIVERANTLTGRLELEKRRLKDAERRSGESAGDPELERAVRQEKERVASVAENLLNACDVMDAVDLETTDCRELLIRTTRDVTRDVLDRKVVAGLLEKARSEMQMWLSESLPRMLARSAVFGSTLLAFWLLSRLLGGFVRRIVSNRRLRISQLARELVAGSVSRLVLFVGLLVALSQLGVEVMALLAGLGIVGFVVGFALQDTLGNFASGAMIVIYQPYDVGDFIQVGEILGQVSAMTLVSTTVLTPDNQMLVVPNSRIWGDVIQVATAQSKRRIDLSFNISHEDDVEDAEKLFASILREHPKVRADPEPLIKVHRLTDSAVEFIVRPWVDTQDYWEVYWDITRAVKLGMVREGMTHPYPQRDVHLHTEGG